MNPKDQFQQGLEQVKALQSVKPYVNRGAEILASQAEQNQKAARGDAGLQVMKVLALIGFFATAVDVTRHIVHTYGGVSHISFGGWVMLISLWAFFKELSTTILR